MNNFDTMLPEIKNKLHIKHDLGFANSQFIENTITHRTIVSHPKLRRIKISKGTNVYGNPIKHTCCITLSDMALEDVGIMNYITSDSENRLIKLIWRINQKRIAHGLENWF